MLCTEIRTRRRLKTHLKIFRYRYSNGRNGLVHMNSEYEMNAVNNWKKSARERRSTLTVIVPNVQTGDRWSDAKHRKGAA